jgi:hypothetical protein
MADNGKVPAPGGRRRDSSPYPGDPRQRITSEDNSPGSRIAEMIAPFIGKQIPGGCDYCDAYQTIEPIPGFEDTGAWLNHIHHDDTCPWWIRHQAATP